MFFAKTRFLSLMLAIKKIVQMFKPFKEYVGSIEYSLKDLFKNPLKVI